MDSRTLETFVHVLRSGAVSQTALRLNITQSAVSRRLQGLEQELGVKLFVPAGRGIRPTDAAIHLIPEIEAALQALEAIKSKAPKSQGNQSALRVAATPQTIAAVLAPALPSLRDDEIGVTFSEAGGAEIAELVLKDFCDCGITAHPAFEAGLKSSPIGTLALNGISPNLPEMKLENGEMDIAALFEHKLLILDRTYQSRKILDAAFGMENQVQQIGYEGRSPQAILAMAQAGAGVAILPSNIKTQLPTASLTFKGRPLLIETTLIWHQSSRQLQSITALAKILQKRAQTCDIFR